MMIVGAKWCTVFLVLVILRQSRGQIVQSIGGNGGLFGQETDLSPGDNAGYPNENNGYLPPENGGLPSDLNPAFSNPPREESGNEILGASVLPASAAPAPAAPRQPQLGCAAALICVEEQFCDITGMISKTPLRLTESQKLRQVPMVDCKNPENGVIGKCCRDPDYVDPWPAGDFPKNYQGGFDEQGFPVAWNISKTAPKRPVNKPGRVPVRPLVEPTVTFEPTRAPVRIPQQPFQANLISSETVQNNQRGPGSFNAPQQQPPRPVVGVQQPVTPILVTSAPAILEVRPTTQRPKEAIQQQFNPSTQQPSVTQFSQPPTSFNVIPQRPQQPQKPFSQPPASFNVIPQAPRQPITQAPFVQPQRPIGKVEYPTQPAVQVTQKPIQFTQPERPQAPENFGAVQLGQPQQPPKTFDFPNIPQTINNFINRPDQQGEIVDVPQVADTPVTEKPGIFNLPSLPSFPSIPNIQFPSIPGFGGKEIAPTSVQIEAHQPGYQCGIINQVSYNGQLKAHEVPFGEIPWMVMILNNVRAKPICSGALVAPDRVLTAAHCVDGLRVNEVSIKVGEWKLGYDLRHEEPYPTEIIGVASIVPHPAYHVESSSHDLVVLMLQRPVKLDQHVDTICVSESAPVPVTAQRKCISVGWGKPAIAIHAAGAIMKKINVSPLSDFECTQKIRNSESQIELDESLVCVKAAEQSGNMCMVDGGSPLACEREDGTYEILGVYSTETGCQPTNQVATFAKIDAQWVNNVGAPLVQEQTKVSEKVNYVNYPGSLPSGLNEYLPPV